MTPEQAQAAKTQNRLISIVLVALLAFGAGLTINILYTQHAIEQADSRWCVLIGGLDDRYATNVPKGSEEFAAQIHELRRGLHCPIKGATGTDNAPGSGEPDGSGD
jgi:hypothetical protein